MLQDPWPGFLSQDTMSARNKPRTGRQRSYPSAGYTDKRARDLSLSRQPEDMDTVEKSEALIDPEAKSFFNGIAHQTPCVFLCLGSPENCRVVQVQVRDDDEEEKVFNAMKESWSENRKWMPFRKVTGVQEVTFRFIGQQGSEKSDNPTLVGIYEPLDTMQLHKSLRDELEAAKEAASLWQSPDIFDMCRQEYTSGEWQHIADCPSHWHSYRGCDIEKFERVQHHLRSLSLKPALTIAFHNPSLAKGQRLLDGLQQGPGLYSARDMLRNLYWHNPRIGNVEFNGYNIIEGWDESKCMAAVILVVMSSIGSTAIFRIVFGDWPTAIAASTLGLTALAFTVPWMSRWSMF
ncbi:hypothetical protein FVEG_11726 [Fusarium verticillioides 7600]|uniref:Uncharacterized protein n=1 Tax=Gibberella moniliformis (strain M3125 / FGSC 7600) TaxID=334819 RepID=W7MZK0_GIBM7|nr:hypothetical protein FVEG_11726 [Fusarium verticillioides 7600]EWG53255.1 hypothetical protein FVEG_11726 [Fusarium verticillioides 7600]